MRLEHFQSVTIRELPGGPCDVKQDAWEAICTAARFGVRQLNCPDHLFMSVIGADVIRTGEGDDECGFAMYHSGVHHVVVCGGDGPDEVKDDRQHWLRELMVSTVHGIVHYWQDINGRLDGSKENETEADERAREIVDKIPLSQWVKQ